MTITFDKKIHAKKEVDIPDSIARRIVKNHRGRNPHISYDEIYQIAWIENNALEFSNDATPAFKAVCVYRKVIDELRRTRVYSRGKDVEFVSIEEALDKEGNTSTDIEEVVDFVKVCAFLSKIKNGRRLIKKFLEDKTYTEAFKDLNVSAGRVSVIVDDVIADLKLKLEGKGR